MPFIMPLMVVIILGVLLRVWLLGMPEFCLWLASRAEVSTPLTSWDRLVEGNVITLSNPNNFYEDSYHGTSLLLELMSFIMTNCPYMVNLIFVATDVITAVTLFIFSKRVLRNKIETQGKCMTNFPKGISSILIKMKYIDRLATIVCSLYLLNPFTLATCIAKSLVTFHNLFIALFLLSAVSGFILPTMLFLALSTYETLYPIQLVPAACLCLWKYQVNQDRFSNCVFKCCMSFILWISLIFAVNYLYEVNIQSVVSHYIFILLAPDQTPNVGIFWYFFTEVFDHFRTFFLCVFQINVVVYSLPMTLKFRSHPIFLTFVLLAITSIFKSYPSVGDAALWLCILPLWSHSFPYLRYPSVTAAMLLTSSILCPTMWNMWINAHSANANFYFAATLSYTTSLVLITTDTAMAFLNWHLRLREGIHPRVPGTNEKAVLRLLN